MVGKAAMIARQTDVALVRAARKRSRGVALLVPHQRVKTTLARQSVPADSLNFTRRLATLGTLRVLRLQRHPNRSSASVAPLWCLRPYRPAAATTSGKQEHHRDATDTEEGHAP
jgi:hypothetical protein